jgi:hypothetical protein
VFEIENPLTGSIGLFSRRTIGLVPPSGEPYVGVGGSTGAFAGPLSIASAGWTQLSGFDLNDWYWSCNKWVIGSFSRSQPLVIADFSFNYNGATYTIPGLTTTASIAVAV